MILLRFPQPAAARVPGSTPERDSAAPGNAHAPVRDPDVPPANLRFLLTPDHDPALDYLDHLLGLDILDDTEREARIAVARQTGS